MTDNKYTTGTTSSGFSFSIDRENLNDMEFIDLLGEAEEGDPLALSKAFTIILGKEQKAKLYGHLKAIHGKVPVDVFINEMGEILSSGKELKN